MGMGFHADRYRKEVLDPARARGNRPPADLIARYALGQPVPDFQAHVEQVVGYWRGQAASMSYSKLAQALLVAHAELKASGDLASREDLIRRAEREGERVRERLSKRARDLAGAYSCASPVMIAAIVDDFGGLVDAVAVRAALQQHDVRVAEPVPLPDAKPAKYAGLQRDLHILGLRLSAEVVFGDRVRRGFSVLRGFRLTAGGAEHLGLEHIQAARKRLESALRDERHVAQMTVLSILTTEASKPGGLDALLLAEVVEHLRRAPAARVSQRSLASQAVELGLDRTEADALALSVFQAAAGRSQGELDAAQQALSE
ncbi:MAG: hypothetical protein M3170_01340, partial [Candidatus Dormibacteraeota bacterium]|nr:hypothetical protein [Candidatus Dormibacteraeota bacterium]